MIINNNNNNNKISLRVLFIYLLFVYLLFVVPRIHPKFESMDPDEKYYLIVVSNIPLCFGGNGRKDIGIWTGVMG